MSRRSSADITTVRADGVCCCSFWCFIWLPRTQSAGCCLCCVRLVAMCCPVTATTADAVFSCIECNLDTAIHISVRVAQGLRLFSISVEIALRCMFQRSHSSLPSKNQEHQVWWAFDDWRTSVLNKWQCSCCHLDSKILKFGNEGMRHLIVTSHQVLLVLSMRPGDRPSAKIQGLVFAAENRQIPSADRPDWSYLLTAGSVNFWISEASRRPAAPSCGPAGWP